MFDNLNICAKSSILDGLKQDINNKNPKAKWAFTGRKSKEWLSGLRGANYGFGWNFRRSWTRMHCMPYTCVPHTHMHTHAGARAKLSVGAYFQEHGTLHSKSFGWLAVWRLLIAPHTKVRHCMGPARPTVAIPKYDFEAAPTSLLHCLGCFHPSSFILLCLLQHHLPDWKLEGSEQDWKWPLGIPKSMSSNVPNWIVFWYAEQN